MPLYLYHATDINNLDSIMSKGLLKNPGKHNWDGMYTDDGVYLAFDADVAESYAETADVEFDKIVILRIPLNKLDQNYIEYDWNNRCEYVDDINSCVYRKDIPPSIIEITTSDNEPGQNIHDFEGTDMYEWILQTFEEEVETNMEESFCYGMKLRIAESHLPLRKVMRKINKHIVYHKGRYSTLQERLEKHDSGIIITDYAGDVVNLLINKPKPYRIVYDTVFDIYGIGDAYNFIHGDIQDVLKEYGYEEKTTHTVTLRSKKVNNFVVRNHEVKSQVLLSFEPYSTYDMSWEVGGFVGERASSCYITTGVILTTSPLDIKVPDLYNNIKKRNLLLDKSYESKIIYTLEQTALVYQDQELSIIDKIVSDSDFEYTDYKGCYNYLLKYNKRPDFSNIFKGFVPGETLDFPHNLDYRLHDVQGKIIDIYHKIQDIKKYGIQYMKDTFGDLWDVTDD